MVLIRFAAGAAAGSRVGLRDAIPKGHVFLVFLYAHWRKQDLWPRTLREFCRLARGSAISGEVQFLGKSAVDRADIERHLSPARDFERP